MGPPPPDRTIPKPGGTVDRRRFSSVPPTWITGIDRVPDVESALVSLHAGNFRQAALLGDAAMRDDRIWSVMDTRLGVIRGAEVEIKPADQSAKAEEVATTLGGDEDESGVWEDLFPAPTVADLLQYGWLNGIAVAEIVWTPDEEGFWTPRLVPVHPQFIYWDWGTRTYRLVLEDGIISLPDVMARPFSDGKWFVWCPFGYQYAWRKAMVKPLADLYLQRRWNARDWSRYNEKHGSPVDLAFVPEDADDKDKEAFFNDVVTRGADTAVQVPRRDGQSKDDGYGLGLLEATAKTFETFERQQSKLDNSVAILFWGQNLTTEVQEGTGSRAAEQGHQKVADIKTKEDAAIARVLRQQVLSWWAHFNFGDAALAPRCRYVVEPPTDDKDEGEGYKAIGEGVKALKEANPKTDVDALYDGHGIPMLTEEQLAEEQRAAREAMMKMLPPGAGVPGQLGPDGKPIAKKQGEEDAPEDGDGEDQEDDQDDQDDQDDEGDEKKPPQGRTAEARLKNTGELVVARRVFAGFRIAIENRAGTVRSWYDPEGRELGRTTMRHDYGFFEDYQGADGEELDVYLGPDQGAPDVHIVHQLRRPGYDQDDEDKVFLGFPDGKDAKAAFCAHRDDGARAFGGMTTLPMAIFQETLRGRRGGGKITARGDGT